MRLALAVEDELTLHFKYSHDQLLISQSWILLDARMNSDWFAAFDGFFSLSIYIELFHCLIRS